MRYTGQDITISLDDRPDPGDGRLTVNDIGTFTIWCQRFGVFFSVLEIPKGLMSLGAVVIGELPDLDHGIQGTLAAKDETTLLIKNFHYDGQAPGLCPSSKTFCACMHSSIPELCETNCFYSCVRVCLLEKCYC